MKPKKHIEYYDGTKKIYREYYINDKHHREDGPASIWYHENGNIISEHYYINNEFLTKQEFDKLLEELTND